MDCSLPGSSIHGIFQARVLEWGAIPSHVEIYGVAKSQTRLKWLSSSSRPPCPSPTPGVHSNSRPSSQWCHPAISSSVIPFSSCPQSLPASESSPVSQLFAWGGQSTGVSALASFLPKNTQDWSPLEWTGWVSLQSMGLSRVFSNTAVQKHHHSSKASILRWYISRTPKKETLKTTGAHGPTIHNIKDGIITGKSQDLKASFKDSQRPNLGHFDHWNN